MTNNEFNEGLSDVTNASVDTINKGKSFRERLENSRLKEFLSKYISSAVLVGASMITTVVLITLGLFTLFETGKTDIIYSGIAFSILSLLLGVVHSFPHLHSASGKIVAAIVAILTATGIGLLIYGIDVFRNSLNKNYIYAGIFGCMFAAILLILSFEASKEYTEHFSLPSFPSFRKSKEADAQMKEVLEPFDDTIKEMKEHKKKPMQSSNSKVTSLDEEEYLNDEDPITYEPRKRMRSKNKKKDPNEGIDESYIRAPNGGTPRRVYA